MFRIIKNNYYKFTNLIDSILFVVASLSVTFGRPYLDYISSITFIFKTTFITILLLVFLNICIFIYKKNRITFITKHLKDNEKIMLSTNPVPFITFLFLIAFVVYATILVIILKDIFHNTNSIILCFCLCIFILIFYTFNYSTKFLIFTNKKIICITLFNLIYIPYHKITSITDSYIYRLFFSFENKDLIIYPSCKAKIYNNIDENIPKNISEILNKIIKFCKKK